jgi:hypothetical protein
MQDANAAYFQRKNPHIRIFCISGWLAVAINPYKWSSIVYVRGGVGGKTTEIERERKAVLFLTFVGPYIVIYFL